MSAISACLRVAKDLSDDDRDAILERLDRYTKDGIPNERAQIMAAADMLAELQDERREFMRMLKEQHPDIFRVEAAAPEIRKSADRPITDEVLSIALKESKALSGMLSNAIETDAQGVIPGRQRMLDRDLDRGRVTLDEIKEAFKQTRAALRSEHGDEMTLWRADALDDGKIDSTRTVYMANKDVAEKYANNGRVAKPYVVNTDDVLGVYARPSGYYEAIVRVPEGGLAEPQTSRAQPNITKSADRTPLGFYSSLARGVEEMPTKQAMAGAWKAQIKGLVNKGVVKADEIEWSGINDWLDLQQGKVTKEQIAEYLEQGGVKVEETVLGTANDAASALNRDLADTGYTAEADNIDDEVVFYDPDGDMADYLDLPPEVQKIVDRQRAQEPARYDQYTLPGGENYREVLLRLPTTAPPDKQKYYAEEVEREFARGGMSRESYEHYRQDPGAWFPSGFEPPNSDYKSNHWDQPNVLAHIRLNDRTDADGNKVLFVEELQSDWGQDGKKKGFGGVGISGFKYDEATGDWVKAEGRDATHYGDASGRDDRLFDSRSEAERKLSAGVPAAPFVTKTEGWLNLALKRVMVLAAEGGYDKVAFVNGEQSADRYDLSKQIDSITAQARWSGDAEVADRWLIEARRKGDRGIVINAPYTAEQLPDVIGKELAEKIVSEVTPANPLKRYSNLDLKVGGEGMKTFYDKIVPLAVNKLLPKVGGEKLGAVEIHNTLKGRDVVAAQLPDNHLWGVYDRHQGRWLDNNDQFVSDPEDAGAYSERAAKSAAAAIMKEAGETLTQTGFVITDKMREAASVGVPLFSPDRESAALDGQDDGDTRLSVDRGYEPKNTVKAYKLFRVDAKQPGKLFPLFVNANKAVPMGEWLKAEAGPMTGGKVKSKLGPLAFRPGWHAGDVPVATHIGLKDSAADKAPKYRNPDHVWAEVEFADDVDWQEEANKRGTNASGKLVPVKAHITDRVPKGGFYRYKTNPNMTGNWLIGGEMKVTRILSDDDVQAINDAAGVADLPRQAPFDVKKYGFDIRKSADRPWFDDLSKLKVSTNYQLGDLLKSSKKLSWWDRTVGTQYNLAQKHPQFKRVFDAVQTFINDVSAYATRAADLAPTILPKLETLKDITKSPLSAEDVKALRDPIFGGTLKYTRDDEGNIIETEDASTAGVVFTNAELRDLFGLNDRQVELYREFRRATNKSLTDLAVSDMLRYLGTDGEGVRQRALDATNLDGALNAMVAHLDMMIEQQPERAKVLEDSKRAIKEKAGQAIGLMARGYAPLSRFGQYTVYAVGQDGEQLYFSMFENERDANKMAREMREQYPDATVTTGTMSTESYKLFSGVTPETLALFGESLGLEESGVDAKSEVFQQYLKMAKTNRSAMKRLIQRKGIDGFSEDAGRVLAGFVYSNARQISTNLHAGEISRSAAAVTDGDVKDAAIRLMEYVQNPMEEAQAIRGLMFTQFIGGSIASAMVNMTQPFTMTMPYLSQFDGVTGAAKRMADAVKLVSRGVRNDEDLQKSLKRAEQEGVVSPQEVHQLMAQAQGRGSLQAGDGTKVGDAAAKVNNSISRLSLVWGKLFSAAEQFNRRVTFIAAYKLARDQGMADPFAFAEQAIAETQGVYNKGNKPKWARGAVGSTLFTFKQYSIAYMEFLVRMWGNGPEGKKAVGLALGVLFLTAGLGGLPGMDDLDDVIDGFMQRVLGRSFDSKQAKKEFIASLIGQSGAEFVMSGLSGLPGAPIDIAGRMGLGNLIPGTGLLTKKRDYGRDYLEVVGPAGTLFANAGAAVANVAQGEFKKAAESLAPVAAQNALKALDMAQMGYYRDVKGRKVVDTDGFDAVAKAIGFQPRAVAQVQDATGTLANLIAQNKLRETEIADKWAQGRIERNPDKVSEAKQELADWNRNNPQSPIRIDESQVNKRVQEANKTKAQRVAATAPKEIRGAAKKQLEAELND